MPTVDKEEELVVRAALFVDGLPSLGDDLGELVHVRADELLVAQRAVGLSDLSHGPYRLSSTGVCDLTPY